MEYYSAIGRKRLLPFATPWTELEGITLSETSQAEKDKHQMISLVWSIRTKQTLKERNSRRRTEPKSGLTVTSGKGTREGGTRAMRGSRGSAQKAGGARGGRYNTDATSSDSTASHYADRQ